jgi:hypothetical protein
MMHHGQRKLLLSEIEFLVAEDKKWQKNKDRIFVYVGAAPGVHTYYLAKLFPKVHLYDKVQFFPKLRELTNVTLHQKYFDDLEAKKYSKKNCFFISDIRNLDIKAADTDSTVGVNKANKVVYDDMVYQQDWYKIIKPRSAMFKFRLPWNPGKTKYLDGVIYYQVWPGKHSTEARLYPNKKMKEYDNTEYEERMFFFNRVTRRSYYPHDIKCYDHCYDCRSEIEILTNYLNYRKKDADMDTICKMGEEISKHLNKKLFQKNLDQWDV